MDLGSIWIQLLMVESAKLNLALACPNTSANEWAKL
jgi:hypothetical protein